MSRYSGMSCIVCDKQFDNNDTANIVVCPECGLPHHRECYKQLGHCAMEDKHGTPEQWSPNEVKSEEPSDDKVVCPNCSSENSTDSLFCDKCGFSFNTNDTTIEENNDDDLLKAISSLSNSQISKKSAGPIQLINLIPKFDDNDIIDGISVKELNLYLGKNAHYFIPRFKLFKSGKLNISLNFSSYFGNFIYYFYRKMYGFGLIALIISLFYAVPYLIYSLTVLGIEFKSMPGFAQFAISIPSYMEPLSQYMDIASKISFVLMVFNGFFFNILYKKHVYKKIGMIKNKNLPKDEYEAELAKHGGVNPVLSIVSGSVSIILSSVFILLGLLYLYRII